jgi:hypothetical protein
VFQQFLSFEGGDCFECGSSGSDGVTAIRDEEGDGLTPCEQLS